MYINRIDEQLGKFTELVEDLLDISRLERGRLEYTMKSFEISPFVGEVVNNLGAISSGHKITLKNGVNRKVFADRERIRQVLTNLVSNAFKYSPKDQKVEVFVKDRRESVQVGVRDWGIGIDQDELERIFDRFYRVKDVRGRTFPGLGIGLFICREIIEKHGGKIWAESKKGRGSTFAFSLPASTA